MTPEEVNQMAQKREIRAFADRGTWRFRTQDVEEKARQLGRGSSPDLQLGDAPKAKPHDSPAPGPKQTGESEVFHFQLGSDDEVELGSEVGRTPGGSARMKGPKSPPPKPGSDSDVRLVSEGSGVAFKASSDAKGGPGSGSQVQKKDPGSGTKPKSDSDVKLVQEQTPGDSSIPIGSQPPKSGTDSDIRLEESTAGSGSGLNKSSPDDMILTEEIDLDSELAEAEEAARKKKPKTPHTPLNLTSPYQVQDEATQTGPAAGRGKPTSPDSSSDFSLTPHKDEADSSSPISLSSDEHPAISPVDSGEVQLGGSAHPVTGAASDSGISLGAPGDSGISLERSPGSSDEIEFELSLDEGSTPKPAAKPVVKEDDSSSEFELTLDDSGGLAPLESDERPAKAAAKGKEGSGEKDIFETDFDVPALEDESGSQAVALDESDTDLESSDFDLALGDEDISTEEESGSQVVVLEDEEADEGAATVARTGRRAAAQNLVSDESGETEALPEEAEETYGEEEEDLPVRRVAAADSDWGILPGAVMIPCVIVMLFACVMGFELLRSMWSYRQPSKAGTSIVRFFADTFGAELPKD
jgi:hypothetical protein